MKLYDVPNNTLIKVGETILKFHHLDGMYSFCTTEDGQVAHIFAGQEVEIVPDKE